MAATAAGKRDDCDAAAAAAAAATASEASGAEALEMLMLLMQPQTAYPDQYTATPSREAAASVIMVLAGETADCSKKLPVCGGAVEQFKAARRA